MSSNLQTDRRQSARVPFRAPVQAEQISPACPKRMWHLLTEDLSESGLRLLSYELFPVKSRLLLGVDPEIPVAPIRAVGNVVWVTQLPDQDEWHIGVEFADLSENCRERLRGMMEQRAAG